MGRTLTGVTYVLSCAHEDKSTGQLHGHTWEVTAWFEFKGADEIVQEKRLAQILDKHDHTCLPAELAWGESIAPYVGEGLNADDKVLEAGECVAVDVLRRSEHIYARWEI